MIFQIFDPRERVETFFPRAEMWRRLLEVQPVEGIVSGILVVA